MRIWSCERISRTLLIEKIRLKKCYGLILAPFIAFHDAECMILPSGQIASIRSKSVAEHSLPTPVRLRVQCGRILTPAEIIWQHENAPKKGRLYGDAKRNDHDSSGEVTHEEILEGSVIECVKLGMNIQAKMPTLQLISTADESLQFTNCTFKLTLSYHD